MTLFNRWTFMTVAVLVLCALSLIGVDPALAVRADVTPITPLGPYPVLPVSANALDFAWTACDASNHNQFAFTGRELILVNNTDVGAQTVTLQSVAELGRTGDITTYSLGASEYAAFWAGNQKGWLQTGGKFYLQCSNAAVKYAIFRIPG